MIFVWLRFFSRWFAGSELRVGSFMTNIGPAGCVWPFVATSLLVSLVSTLFENLAVRSSSELFAASTAHYLSSRYLHCILP